MTDFRRDNVGYVFQFFNLLGDLTALENVMLAQEIHGGRDKERAQQVLNLVGLEGMEDRFPSELSGGEQQRVAIARSLAKSPRLLLGDELTGNLDSETTAQVMKVLVKVCRKEKITAIIVTHDVSLTKYATRVIQMDSGKLVGDEPGGRATLNATMDTAEAVAEAAVGVVEKAVKSVGGLIAGAVTERPAVDYLAAFRERDILVATAGADVVRFLPPLIVEQDRIDEVVDVFDEILRQGV